MEVDLGVAITILGLAFGAWAWIVAWGIQIVRKEVTDLKKAGIDTAGALTEHIRLTERRLTMLETEFGFLRRYLGLRTDTEKQGS